MKDKIKKIKEEAVKEIAEIKDGQQIQDLKVKYLGKKSEFNQILKGLKDLSVEDKKVIGPLANQTKNEIKHIN